MNTRVWPLTLTLTLPLVALAACGGDPRIPGIVDAGLLDDARVPDAALDPTRAPILGLQLDRAGRPAVSTALIGAFLDTPADAGLKRNAYSQDSSPKNWSIYIEEIVTNLAIIDALNATGGQPFSGCGDQVLFDIAGAGYATLGGALAADTLLIDTRETSCEQFLAVEAGLAGVNIPDCGGRSPLVDSIDRFYSFLITGELDGVTDGVDADDAVHSDDAFPYLAAPL